MAPVCKRSLLNEVSKATLVNWEQKFKEEINNLRAVELEAL